VWVDALRDAPPQLLAIEHVINTCDTPSGRDTTSGVRTARPGLEACLQAVHPGDTRVVGRLDRLGRSMTHLVAVIEDLRGRQGGFRARCDGALDTTTASGELICHLFAALAQGERRLIQERTRAGRATARARGRTGGAHTPFASSYAGLSNEVPSSSRK
jgi:DNA invertase Pin-like site-specific DNA recombinase